MGCPIAKGRFARQKRFVMVGESGGYLLGSLKSLFTAGVKAWLIYFILSLWKHAVGFAKNRYAAII